MDGNTSLSHTVLIGIGGNVGVVCDTFQQALQALSDTPGVHVQSHSKWIRSTPVGPVPDQADFTNGAAILKTNMQPKALLELLHDIERTLGRRREDEIHWGPRTIDLDLLAFDDLVLSGENIEIPHPRMAQREFVLEPLMEIAPDYIHPILKVTVSELLSQLREKDC